MAVTVKFINLTSFWMCHIQNETFVITFLYRTIKQENEQTKNRFGLQTMWETRREQQIVAEFLFVLIFTVCGTACFDDRFKCLLLNNEYNC